MKNRAIIFDLDGTAVNSPGEKVPTINLTNEVARLQSNFYLSAATGRAWSYAKPVLHSLNLVDPCIIAAGTQICNPKTGEILWQKNIDANTLVQAIKTLQEYPDYKILFNDYTEEEYFNGGIAPIDFKASEPIYFLEQVFIPTSIASKIFEKLKKLENVTCLFLASQKPNCTDIHIINSEATKEHAVAQLLEMISVTKENSIGIGDGGNDLHLFNAVGFKVAMDNAVDALKGEADVVIGNVSEDGLTNYFRELK